jgi:Essential protein Yae1, N terminal
MLTVVEKKRFYTTGYEDGYAHGRFHGLIEGRALGAEKGFELWEELGFYEGAARLWTAVFSTDSNGTDACVPPLPSLTRPSAGLGRVTDPLFFLLPSRVLFSFPFPS